MLKFGEICGRFFEKTKTGGCIRNPMCYTGRNEKRRIPPMAGRGRRKQNLTLDEQLIRTEEEIDELELRMEELNYK